MKTKDVIIFSLVFLACVGVAAEVVVFQLTGNHLLQPKKPAPTAYAATACDDAPRPQRPASDDPQLKAIAEYEQICNSQFMQEMMIFTNMPVSVDTAQTQADAMATRLKKFDAYGIKPVIIAEPDSEWGLIDFHEFAIGDYDEWIKVYFEQLKKNGVSDKQMGTWIPFPEPQQPFWNNNGDPDDFAHSVNRYLALMRTSFPQARTAILLDSQVGSDEASQLVAYTRLVKPELVSMVGLQGFPWQPTEPGDKRKPVTSASQFAPAYMVEEVAKSLNTKDVMINTGSYRHRKTQNGGDVAVSTEQRRSTLDSIIKEAELLKTAGYNVTVNIFAENKLEVKEGVDWSYWQAGDMTAASESHAVLFTQFIKGLKDRDVTVSLYDARK